MKLAAEAKASKAPAAPRVRLVAVERVIAAEEIGPPVRLPIAAARHAQAVLSGKDREHFMVLHLDARHRVVSLEVVSVGTLTSSLVHPRETFKGAILANAVAIIAAHNHPSGDVEPSQEDRALLQRLKDAGQLLGIPLLDFLVVADSAYWSASEQGLMNGGQP